MKKLIIILFIFFSLFKLTLNQVSADSHFNTSFDVTYTVGEDGNTHAVFSGALQNATDKYYASSYTIQLGFDNIEHINSSDAKGIIIPQVKKSDTGESLYLPLNKMAYGMNKSTSFTLSFDTTDIAKQVGSIWEINIPGLANQADYKDFTVHLHVPATFGKPSFVKPVQSGESLDFDKSILGATGIAIAFGSGQNYDFKLLYHLKNSNLFPITTEVALPPTTNYQEILLHDMEPKPANVTLDSDGNWLAKYNLLPSQKITVTANGSAIVSLNPKKEQLNRTERTLYTQNQKYWDIDNSNIKKIARDLKTPENIFNYVVHHLHYDFTRLAGTQERIGAANVLAHPNSAVCLEFTDLFIALSRSAGIPAREIDGYAYTENKQERPLSLIKDVLHAWPEYYDDEKQSWIMVDPTWANTTHGMDYFHILDYDHVVFVIRGTESTYPIPPGGYKLPGDASKDVFVSFGKKTMLRNPQMTVAFDIAPSLFAGIPYTGNLEFKNVSDRLVPAQEVNVSTPDLTPKNQKLLAAAIPPFGYEQLSVPFPNTSFLTNQRETITIRVAGNIITKSIFVYPLFFRKEFTFGGIAIVILSIGLFIFISKTRRLHVFKRWW